MEETADRRVTFRLTASEYALLEKAAAKDVRTVSNFIRIHMLARAILTLEQAQ